MDLRMSDQRMALNSDQSKVSALYLQRVNYILQKTELLVGRSDLTGKIAFVGEEVENLIRTTIEEVTPPWMRVTSGYIISDDGKTLSPNCDLLVVDNKFPTVAVIEKDKIEIVAASSVCAVFEVKRTLTKKIFISAQDQLKKIIDAVGLRKDDDTSTSPFVKVSTAPGNAAATWTWGYHSNPMFCILSLAHEEEVREHLVTELEKNPWMRFDLVWSLSGLSVMTQQNNHLRPIPVRKADYSWESNPETSGSISPWNLNAGIASEKIFHRCRSFIFAYLSGCSAKDYSQDIINSCYMYPKALGME
jgi:hypothetical protein